VNPQLPRFITCVTADSDPNTITVTYLGSNGNLEHGTIPTENFWKYLQNSLRTGAGAGTVQAERKTA